jgi:peptide/nickel transport system substrate-binding protein
MDRKASFMWSLLAMAVLILAACQAPATQAPAAPDTAAPAADEAVPGDGEPRQGGTLNMSLGEDFVTFHPFFDVTNSAFKPIFFDAPIRINDEGEFEPWLAERWEESEDGLSITLYMRQGIQFHNGREVTADDVVWSLEHAFDEEPGHHLADRFQTAASATKIDDYTVQVDYSEVTASKLDGIARLYLFPEEAAETIETNPVGTGPFRFVEWTPGDQVTAVRWENYWREGLPYLDEVIIRALPDEQSRLINLRAGSIDALYGVPLVEKSALDADDTMTVGQVPAGFTFYAFLMNVNAEPFDNQLVRQAVQHAINRQQIADTVFYGHGEVTLVPYPRTSWGYAEDLENYYPYDPERARELLAEAGYPDGFSTQLLVRGAGGPHLDQAQLAQQDLAAVGIDVELLPTELPQYWPQLFDSAFTIVSHSTGDATVDPSGLFEGAACCRPFRNFFGITQNQDDWFPEYEEVIYAARASQDQEERRALYHRALEIFFEQAWTVPTVWSQEVYAVRDYVHGFRTDLDGSIWIDEAWIDR